MAPEPVSDDPVLSNDDKHDECHEAYRECVRSRQDRVRRTIEAHPEAPNADLAKLAGVSKRTIQAARNSTARDRVKAFTPKNTVKLTDLYDHNTQYCDSDAVKKVEFALERCTHPELAYVLCEVIPEFERVLKQWECQRQAQAQPRPK